MAVVEDIEDKNVNDVINHIREYVKNNPDSETTQFIKKCSESTKFDIAIHYLMEIAPLLNKKTLTDGEKQLVSPYQNIINIYTNNKEDK